MTFPSRGSSRSFSGLPATAESVAEHRARLAREQEHAQQRRTEALSGQVSITNTPSERIVIWERLVAYLYPPARITSFWNSSRQRQIFGSNKYERRRSCVKCIDVRTSFNPE
jgi:hypothetical protein